VLNNTLLSRLRPEFQDQLARDLQRVDLRSGAVLIEPERPFPYVYFPTGAVVSFVTELESGSRAEAGMAGYEGFVGLPLLWGVETTSLRGIVQLPGSAMRMSARAFQRHIEDYEFRAALNAYGSALFDVVGLSAVCQAVHPLEQRLAKWLLTVADRTEDPVLHLTQEFLATMLAVQRPTVTVTARLLQAAQMISYRHGAIVIRDRAMLESAACECYSVMHRRLIAEAPGQ